MGWVSNIKYIKLYFRISPLLDDLKGELKMKLSVNVILQILATLMQIVNQMGGLVSPRYQTLVLGILSVAQAAIGVVAHFVNPDGTSAKVAYEPGVK